MDLRCVVTKRHRLRRTSDANGMIVLCTRCGLTWYQPRLFTWPSAAVQA